MADIVWNGGSGDWTDAQDWTPAQVPGSGDNASIAGTEASDVLVSAGETVTASGVVLDNSNATLEVDGVFDAGTITLEAGTLANYGTVADATLVLNGGTLTADEGVFSGDTIQGGFEIGGSDTAIVQGGLTDESLDGTAPGTITIDGTFATLDFNDSETFDNATVLLGSADGFDTLQADGTLTLGSGVTVQTAGTILSDTLGGNGSIINQGTILADATTGTVAIDSDGFENDGVISVTGGDTLDIEPYGTFANDGTLTVGQGSTVAIQYVDGFTNTGAIMVQAGGELDLDIAGAAGTQATGGTVEVDGLLNAEGGTISIATNSAFATLLNYGTIADATLVLNGGTLTADEGVFSADTIQGGFEIGGSDTAIVQGGLTDESLDGTAPGTITIDGSFATLEVADSEALDNTTLVLGSADGFDTLQADGTLTLGSGVTVQTAGTILSDTLGGNGSIINQGTILADATTGTVAIDSDGFENDGVISVTGGDTLDIEPYGTFANDGTLTVGQGSTVAIEYVGGFTNTGAIMVQAGGELDLDIAGAAGTQATGGTVEVDGLLNAEGGTISIATDSAFATLLNYGTIADATLVLNGGTLTADEGVFSADTIQGGFEIGGSDTAIVQGGLTDESLDGTAPGTITIDGSFATLDFNDSETFDNATVLLGSADGFDTLQADGTLTLGSGVTVQTAGTILSDTLGGNGSIINQGTILADATTGTVAIDSDGFENDGVISVTGGDTLDIEPYGTFANDGTLTVGQGSTVAIQYASGFTNTGAIMVQAGGELDLDSAGAAGTQATGGTVEVDGLLNAEGGTISIATNSAFATLLNYGTIADATLVLNGGTLTADEGVFSTDTIQGGFEIGGSDTAIVQGGLTDESLDGAAPGTITIDGSFATLDFNDSETFDNATVLLGSADGFDTLQADGTLTLGSGVTVQTAGTILSDTLGGNGSIINQGTILADATTGTVAIDSDGFENDGVISVTGGDTLDIEPYGTFANDGTLTVGQGSTVAIQYVDAFTNTGAISVDGGTLTVGQSIDGNGGVINLSDDAVVILDGVAAGQTVSFQDGSSLTTTDPQDFAGTVAGFSAGDSITLQGVTDGQESYSNGLLTVTQAGTTVASIAFSGDYQPSDFSAEEVDGNLVLSTDVLPCFAGGTRILTDCGEVAVEDLPEGAQVVTVTDGRRQLSAVTWVGRRAVDITRHPAPEKVRPVRIAQGAFGDNLPARDLLLSPDHAVFAEGVLVPVKYLVNGCTVRFDATISRVVYFHVELIRHEVLLAEGLPAESYLETGGRAMFENAGQPMVLHPDFSPMVWDALGCAPLMVTGPEIEAIRVKLAARVDQVAAA